MHIICTAIVDDYLNIKNLCDRTKILGCKPCVSGNTVCVEFTGPRTTAEKIIDLFENYTVHEISYLRVQRR